jgi:hypothetical protein
MSMLASSAAREDEYLFACDRGSSGEKVLLLLRVVAKGPSSRLVYTTLESFADILTKKQHLSFLPFSSFSFFSSQRRSQKQTLCFKHCTLCVTLPNGKLCVYWCCCCTQSTAKYQPCQQQSSSSTRSCFFLVAKGLF